MEGPEGWGEPLYARVLAGVPAPARVLDVGCGPGVFAAFAAARGYAVTGIDADRSAVAAAARAVPSATFQVGDAHELDGRYDLVACVQLLTHVTNPVRVLEEAGRVGDRVVATVWGRASECDVRVFGEALDALLPPRPGAGNRAHAAPQRAAPGPPPLTEPDRFRRIAALAGLEVLALDEVVCTFQYPDADALAGPVLQSAIGRRAAALAGPRAVRAAVLDACAPFRNGRGYRLRNLFRVLDARA